MDYFLMILRTNNSGMALPISWHFHIDQEIRKMPHRLSVGGSGEAFLSPDSNLCQVDIKLANTASGLSLRQDT